MLQSMELQRVGHDRVTELNKYKRGNQSNMIIIKDVKPYLQQETDHPHRKPIRKHWP